MAGFSFRRFFEGLSVVPKSGADTTANAGDLQVLASDNKLRYNNGTTSSPIVTEDQASIITNKIFGDAAGFTEITTPSTPPAPGTILLYPKTDGDFYTLNSDGVENEIGSGGGSGITGATGEGSGVQIYNASTSTSSNLHFKSIQAGTSVTVTDNGSGTVTLASTAVSGATGEGSGVEIYNSATSTSSNLHFKSIAAGTNITLTDNGAGTVTVASSGSGGGITTVGTPDSIPPPFQNLGAGISGNTIAFQTADTTYAGIVTTGAQTYAGQKTFQAGIALKGGSSGHTVTVNGPSTGNDYSITLPSALPVIGEALTVSAGTGSGPFTLDWVTPGGGGGGVTTIGTIDSQTPSADGGVISSVDLYFQSASATNPGLVNNLSQTFTGPKRFEPIGGSSTAFLTIDPNTFSSIINSSINVNNASQYNFTNTSSGNNAYVQFMVSSDNGGLIFGHSSTGASSGNFQADQGFFLGSGSNGVNIWAQNGTGFIKFITGTTERLRLLNNGNANFKNGVGFGRETSGDSNTSIAATVSIHSVTTLTAARTKTLPAANSVPNGHILVIKDESGTAGSNTLTVACAGSDTVDGLSSVDISINYGSLRLYCDGSSAWSAI